MDIGVVTSFYNGYDRFLPEWAESVCNQTVKPSYIVMVASGPIKDKRNISRVKHMFDVYRIKYTINEIKTHKSMGSARNAAVKLCPTEWVMYLDVDDVLLPGALENISKYEHKADVICTGLSVVGDRKNKIMLFTDTTTESILSGKHGSCSHSPFKRKLWEKSPYIENNDYCEQPLWLGFAQIGAVFVGTEEVCTVYRSRKDGHNMSMSKKQRVDSKKQFDRFVRNGVK